MGFFEEIRNGLAAKKIDVGEISKNVVGDDYVKCFQLAAMLEADPTFINRIVGATDDSLPDVLAAESDKLDAAGIPADVYAHIFSEIALAAGKRCAKTMFINPLSGDLPKTRGYEPTFGAGCVRDRAEDYKLTGTTLSAFAAARAYVRVPYGVTAIGGAAFAGNSSVKSVIVPATVTKIGAGAMQGCRSLKRVYMAPQVTTIEDRAFENATSLESVFAPGVTVIGAGAMKNTALTSTAGFPSVRQIGTQAFADCKNLRGVDLTGVETVGANAFAGCTGIESIRVSCDGASPMSILCASGTRLSASMPRLRTIYADCKNGVVRSGFFADCDCVERIIISGVVKKIESNAFRNCVNLKEIRMTYTDTEIPAECFKDCFSLETLPLFRYVKKIGAQAFSGCRALVDVQFGGEITSIGESAFRNCRRLTAIRVGSTQVFLEGECGNTAFAGCESLKYPPVLTRTAKLGSKCFEGAKNVDIVVCDYLDAPLWMIFPDSKSTIRQVQFRGETVPESAFSELTALTAVRFDSPTKRVVIGKNAFNGDKSLTTVFNGETIVEIGEGAFSGTSLTKLVLTSIEKIEGRAFAGIKKDLTISFPAAKKSTVDAWDAAWAETGRSFVFGAKIRVEWT